MENSVNLSIYPHATGRGQWLLLARDNNGSLHTLGVFATLNDLDAVFPRDLIPEEMRAIFPRMWAAQIDQLQPLY